MPRGNTAPIPADQLTAFVADVFEAAERAGAVTGWTRRRIAIGDVAIELDFVDADLADLATRALRHQLSDQPTGATVRIRAWDSASTGVALPAPRWPWHLNRYEADGVIATYDRVGRRFTLTDTRRGEAVSWWATSAHYPAWEEPAPFRDVLDRLLSSRGFTFLHGASVGNNQRSLLLAGPSGSGKSTTVAVAVATGLTTLGDDYVVLDPDGVACHSLYLTTRLLDSSPAFVDHNGSRAAHDQKSVLLLDEHAPDSLRSTLPLAAIVIPRVGEGAATTWRPTTRFAALRALAPSSLVQLDPRKSSLTSMTELVRRLPVYELVLGSDLDGVAEALRQLLDRAGPAS
jgi:hypothetical protein